MYRKRYVIIISLFVACNLIIGFFIVNNRKHSPQNTYPPQRPQQDSHTYAIEDSATSPASTASLMKTSVLRETDTTIGPSSQRFVVKSAVDGSIRELFQVNETDITFEKIKPENWSPTNRFLFVYIDYTNRRDIIFLKTDGKFTNGNYYLHSTGLYPTMNVMGTKWVDNQTLELQTQDIQTKKPQNYLVSFEDDSGIVIPESQ